MVASLDLLLPHVLKMEQGAQKEGATEADRNEEMSFVGDEVAQCHCRSQGGLGLAPLGLPRGRQEAWKLWD